MEHTHRSSRQSCKESRRGRIHSGPRWLWIPKEALSFDTHNVFGAAVTLTQPVFMGGEIKALNDIARYAEKLPWPHATPSCRM